MSVLGAVLLQPPTAVARGTAPVEAAQHPAEPAEPAPADEPQTEAGLGQEDEEEEVEDVRSDPAPDALHDPILSKLLKQRLIIDRPRFSMETRGKLQVQYYVADSDDPQNQDEVFIRRLRPSLMGHLGKNKKWGWKFEFELGADIEAGGIDFDQLDTRDFYVRYEDLSTYDWRLTLGNHKIPFSRDFMTTNTHLLLVERTSAGDTNAGVPDRALGIHLRGEARDGRLAYWGSLGVVGHVPDARLMKFDSLVGARSDLNEGDIIAARLDLHPRGPMTFFDSDPHTPVFKTTWSLAGYAWENNGNNNRFTARGIGLDPLKADLDSATGLEVSGGLRGRGVTLDWQYNRIRGATVAKSLTSGIYVDGVTHLDVSAIEGGYRIRGTPVEFGGALTRLEADGFSDPWDKATLVLNLYGWWNFFGKLQISHSWTSSRLGVPGADFQETRVQTGYGW